MSGGAQTNEESEAFRHWRDVVGFSRGESATRDSVDRLLAWVAEGWMFRPGEADLDAALGDFPRFGLATSLRRFWPRLKELVAGNEALARRIAELSERVHIIELDLDGFAAGTRRFPDGSCLVQLDTGLLLTIFEVVQLFVAVSMPDPQMSVEQTEREAAVVLELVLAEYRLLRGHATPNGTLATPAQGDAIGELTQAANVFVLVHEVSHLLLGHAGDRDDEQRQQDEIDSDVLAFRLLAGVYAADPTIAKAQAHGRLLGARLLFSCIELFERATFVTTGRTHPPAAYRWAVVRLAAEQTFGSLIPDGVDELWQPMDRLLTAAELPLADVRETLESMKARDRFIGDAADVPSAVNLIRRFRLTNATVDDPARQAEGVALANAARIDLDGRAAISWSDLLQLQIRRYGGSTDECALAVAVAAPLLLVR